MTCTLWFMRIMTTDLKIDWISHLLINVLQILKPEISHSPRPHYKLSVPLYYTFVLQNYIFRFFNPFVHLWSGWNFYETDRRLVEVYWPQTFCPPAFVTFEKRDWKFDRVSTYILLWRFANTIQLCFYINTFPITFGLDCFKFLLKISITKPLPFYTSTLVCSYAVQAVKLI